VQFEDVNNDGFADLFIAKGNVDRMPDFAQKDPNNLLMGQADGTFREAGHEAGVDSMSNSRGAALSDFNLDGRVDLVVTARRQPARVWQNVTETAGHWIEMQLAQDGANADAVGARFEIKRDDGKIMSREVLVGGGQAGGALGWIHMGLGDMANPEVRVVWPDGKADDWHRMQADRLYVCRWGQAPSVF
jgi:hypothetical protein